MGFTDKYKTGPDKKDETKGLAKKGVTKKTETKKSVTPTRSNRVEETVATAQVKEAERSAKKERKRRAQAQEALTAVTDGLKAELGVIRDTCDYDKHTNVALVTDYQSDLQLFSVESGLSIKALVSIATGRLLAEVKPHSTVLSRFEQ